MSTKACRGILWLKFSSNLHLHECKGGLISSHDWRFLPCLMRLTKYCVVGSFSRSACIPLVFVATLLFKRTAMELVARLAQWLRALLLWLLERGRCSNIKLNSERSSCQWAIFQNKWRSKYVVTPYSKLRNCIIQLLIFEASVWTLNDFSHTWYDQHWIRLHRLLQFLKSNRTLCWPILSYFLLC